MKIKKIKINNYGNLENKEINLKNKINIIYGKNESGKSTLLNYIKNIFYGISKNKNGKNISDYEKYKPWGKEDYSGKLVYELDNGEEYEIYREFNKKNPKIFNSNLEDISKNFNIVKKDGVQFFIDQTNVDETMFTSTVLSMQEEVKLDRQEQSILVQKLANLAGTGDDNLSYKKIIDRLNKLQLEQVGSDRSQGRPINIVKDRMKSIEFVLKELQEYQKDKEMEDGKKQELIHTVNELERKIGGLKNISIMMLRKQNEEEKINIKNKYKNEKKEKINELNLEKNKLNNKIIQNKKNDLDKKIEIKKYFFILIFILLINILIFIFNKNIIKNNILNMFNLLLIPIYLIYIFIFEKINNKKIKNKINLENQKINNEINLLNKQITILEEEFEKEEQEINNEQIKVDNIFDIELQKIKNKYNEVNVNYYLDKIEKNDINNEIENLQNQLNKNKLNLQTIKIKEEDISKKLEEMVNLKEEYDNLKEILDELEKKNTSIDIAKEILNKAYINMKNNITPKFTQNLSNNISKISNGKYNKVAINEDKGLIVENQYGEYVEAESLSVGTIDQLYLSLRLSMIDDLSNEKMPIMLDEAFAYYDDERLENILRFLNENLENHQAIIFTCTHREKNILEKLNIEFNLVQL